MRSGCSAWPKLCWTHPSCLMASPYQNAGTKIHVTCSHQLGKHQNKLQTELIQKRQRLTPMEGWISSRGGSLSNSFHCVPLSQHLLEWTVKIGEWDGAVGAEQRPAPFFLPADWDVSFEHALLSLSKTHTQRRFSSHSVITWWWGTVSTAQWGGVIRQSVLVLRLEGGTVLGWCGAECFLRPSHLLLFFCFDTLHNSHHLVMTITLSELHGHNDYTGKLQ